MDRQTVPEGGRRAVTDGGTERRQLSDVAGLAVVSPAFERGEALPRRYTCDGAGESPPLAVAGVPEEATSLALVVDDPDAPGQKPFVHWLLWNVPADTDEIPAGVPKEEIALGGARQGRNDGGTLGYFAACPSRGDDPHEYRVTVYALDRTLDLHPGARHDEVARAIDDALVEQTTLTATYRRAE
ncbi:YbhB/YbcL family Raf kinase inhibitor-like protein [Halogeometricum sp. S1BR25-6]|uniref:YbhB/YbcL family Raf kinase inhibitor-like protein n=1 Tax=Halogeometricum salsisoli TaxID=2950536 RepID=A0ABU2GE76_9EURY|nr:YbhB/YbcL family Raf kinase inhibitor-like protein [Halogeometricum sp. S1BR25-6]MDS0298403.1 YbhB/YbcL family Raf kinase inhibitor-like protein [Halogeometricum sp. S1BR25-6]